MKVSQSLVARQFNSGKNILIVLIPVAIKTPFLRTRPSTSTTLHYLLLEGVEHHTNKLILLASYFHLVWQVPFLPSFFFLFRMMFWLSSRRQVMVGCGVPSALQISVALWFSRTLTVEGELSRSMMFGGTNRTNVQKYQLTESYRIIVK